MIDITKEQLEELYINQNLSIKEIKAQLKVSSKYLMKLLKQYDLSKPKDKIREQRRITNQKKYGTNHPSQNKEVKAKTQQTNLERYGSLSPLGNKDIQEKIKTLFRSKYQVDSPLRSSLIREKIQQTNLERYGHISPLGNEAIRAKANASLNKRETVEKRIETQKLRGTINSSEPEEKAYHLLVEKFGCVDVFRQYRSELYPFPCDFYIKSLDLYIEFQGSWVHGRTPYDPDNLIHQKIVQKWREKDTDYFSYAVKVWTIKDPLKRQTAQENNLNWKEFFNLEDLKDWLAE